MTIQILHNAPQYVVCVKPHGVESEKQMPQLLCEQLGLPLMFPVHRLDRDTAGVMVYAKTKEGAAYFSKQIAENKVTKEYVAVVKGTPSPLADTLTDLLFRDKQKNKSYVVKRMRKGVKKAILSYETIGEFPGELPHSLVKIQLQTGRTHQIRVQFASRQMPLLGDKKYGGQPYSHLCLFAQTLSFTTPQGEQVTFTAIPTF